MTALTSPRLSLSALAVALLAGPALAAPAPRPAPAGITLHLPAAPRPWAIRTHMWLAEEVLKDALDDGKLTIERTDYVDGKVVGVLGHFDVDPLLLAALRSHPAQFRAGVMAGDAYPDVLTGQQIVHPDVAVAGNHGLGGHDAWLRQLLDSFDAPSTPPAARAFVAGVLFHSAGDMYGHTFVNHFTGSAFTVDPIHNAKNHLLIDSYVGSRSPTVMALNVGKSHTERIRLNDVSIAGAEEFIYQRMINATPKSHLDEHLLPPVHETPSLPRIFLNIRLQLAADIARFAEVTRQFDAMIKAKYDSAVAIEPKCTKTAIITDCTKEVTRRLKTDAFLLEGQRTAHVTVQGPIRDYKLQWQREIDAGLRALPTYSQRVVLAVLYPISERHGLDEATKIAGEYFNKHAFAMLGAPPEIGSALHTAGQVIAAVGRSVDEIERALIPIEVRQAIDSVLKIPVDAMVGLAFGMTTKQLENYVKAPHTYFDSEMRFNDPPHMRGTVVTLAQMNDHLGLADRGFTTASANSPEPAEYVDWRKVPPLYNTVVLTKLTLLSEPAMGQVLQQIGFGGRVGPGRNMMLGFLSSIDGDNQWHGGKDSVDNGGRPRPPGPKMALAYDCAAYRQIFMQQIGEVGPFSCARWTPTQLAAAGTNVHQASPVGETRVTRAPTGTQLSNIAALQRTAATARPARATRPLPPVHPADAGYELSMRDLEQWAKASGAIAASGVGAELARDRGPHLTRAIDALAASLSASREAMAALGAARFSPRDFARVHLTLLRAVAAQRDPAQARGVSAANVRFVASQRAEIERLLRDGGVPWAALSAAP